MACIAGALTWAQFRGFDPLDGGYYFLLYQDPADNPDTHTRFNLLARPIWLFCRQDIVAFRITCLLIASGVCWIFWRAFRRLLCGSASFDTSPWALWLATIAGLTWVPVALTYNSLATLLGLVGVSLLLALGDTVKYPALFSLRSALLLSALATMTVLIFFAKPPAAAAFVGISFVLLRFSGHCSRWQRRSFDIFALLFFLAATAAVCVAISHPEFGKRTYIHINGIILNPAWIRETLVRYVRELAQILPSFGEDLFWTGAPIVIACSSVLFRGSRRIIELSLELLLISVFAALVYRRLWDGSFSAAVTGEAARYYFLLIFTLVPLWAVTRYVHSAVPAAAVLTGRGKWIFIFLILPFISSLGSTNTLFVAALHSTVFWAAGLLLLADQISTMLMVPWFRSAVAGLLCIGAAGHVFSGHFLKPYMYQSSLWRQTAAVEVGIPPTRLKVDPQFAQFLESARTKLENAGFKHGDDIFGFFNLPGLVFALGAREPGAPWYFGTWYHQDDTDGGKLRLVPLERRQRAWILTQADVTQFRLEFLQSGINFPDGYVKIGEETNPYTGLIIGIWKPAIRN